MPCLVPAATQLGQSTLLTTVSHGPELGGKVAGGRSFLHPCSLSGAREGGQRATEQAENAGVRGSGAFLRASGQRQVLPVRAPGKMNSGRPMGAAHCSGTGLMVQARIKGWGQVTLGTRPWEGRGGLVGSVAEPGRAMPGSHRKNCPLQKPIPGPSLLMQAVWKGSHALDKETQFLKVMLSP